MMFQTKLIFGDRNIQLYNYNIELYSNPFGPGSGSETKLFWSGFCKKVWILSDPDLYPQH